MVMAYVFPLLLVAGFAVYYSNIYKKGKVAGGGMMAGFRANEDEKWSKVMQAGETIAVHGAGTVWRPSWQAFIASQMPIMRLVWPTEMYAIVITNRDRVLIGSYAMLGAIDDASAHPRSAVRVERSLEQKADLMTKLNPTYQMFGAAYTTCEAVIAFPDKTLRLTGVPTPFLEALKHGAPSVAGPITTASA
jgi:hypothetical protein